MLRFISLLAISVFCMCSASSSRSPSDDIDLAKTTVPETCGSYNQRTGKVETCKNDDGSQPVIFERGDEEVGGDEAKMLPAGSGDGTPLELGSSAQLDKIGPMVVQLDGTLRLIENWEGMTERERLVTWKRVTERNRQRLAAIEKMGEKEGKEGGG